MVFFGAWLLINLLWIVTIVDAARRPDEQWRAIGRSKGAWVALTVIAGWFGALFYAFRLRPQLASVAGRRTS